MSEENINTGTAEFNISGIANVNETLTLVKKSDDPDGNGEFSYKWESSSDGINWENIGEGISYEITPSEENKQLRAKVFYTDNDGIDEEVYASVAEAVGNKIWMQFGLLKTNTELENDHYLQNSKLIELFNNGNSMAVFNDDNLGILKLVNNQWILEYEVENVKGSRRSYSVKYREINFSEDGE